MIVLYAFACLQYANTNGSVELFLLASDQLPGLQIQQTPKCECRLSLRRRLALEVIEKSSEIVRLAVANAVQEIVGRRVKASSVQGKWRRRLGCRCRRNDVSKGLLGFFDVGTSRGQETPWDNPGQGSSVQCLVLPSLLLR